MLRVRRATEDDRLNLFKLCIQMHQETDFQAVALNPEKVINSLGLWINGNLSLVVVKDSDIVGMLFASVNTPWFSDERYATEDILYVTPEYRGTRAGYLLVRGFMDWVKQTGVKHVRAGVSTGTGPAAERLYRHFGMSYMGGNFIAHF